MFSRSGNTHRTDFTDEEQVDSTGILGNFAPQPRDKTGLGYAQEYHVERYLREILLPRTAPVSPHMIGSFLAETVLGLSRCY